MSDDLKNKVIEAFGKAESRINYAKIHAYMVLTNWKWYIGDKMKTPSKQELRTNVFDLFDSLMEKFEYNKCHSAKGGGFHINYWFWDENNIEIEILFAIQDESITL